MHGLLVALISLALLGCGSSAPPSAGLPTFLPPVGVEMPASGGVPAVILAVSTTRAGVLDSLVEPLTGAIHAGLVACPEFVDRIQSGGDSTLVISLGRSALQVEPSAREDDISRCMAGIIDRPAPGLPADPQLMARVQVILQDPGTREK